MKIEDCQNLLEKAESAIQEVATYEDDADFCQKLLMLAESVKEDWGALAALIVRLAVSGTTAEPKQASLLHLILSNQKSNSNFL